METVTMAVRGMSCGHCVARVTRALQTLAGVEPRSVKVGEVTVAYDPASSSTARIAHAIEEQGFEVAP